MRRTIFIHWVFMSLILVLPFRVPYSLAIETTVEDAETSLNRGNAYYKKGEYDRAISDYKRALEINPRYAEAYYNKALACEKAGLTKEAIEAYRGFIQYAPPQYAGYIEQVRQRIRELGK